MKSIRSNILLVALVLFLPVECVFAGNKVRKMTCTPSLCVLTPDSTNSVKLDFIFNVPKKYCSKRSRLVITPQLVVRDSVVAEYVPLAVDTHIYEMKRRRKEVLEGYVDPYDGILLSSGRKRKSLSLPYAETVELPLNSGNGKIVAMVSVDGCGKCSALDSIEMAGISDPVELLPEIGDALELNWIEPEFVIRPKVMEGMGVANLEFDINRHDINFGLGNNREELEKMIQTLSPVLNDSLATLNSLDICGMASADGPVSFNTLLARRRAESARRWMRDTLSLRPEVERIVTVSSRPEGWWPVFMAMKKDRNPDSLSVKNILEKYTDVDDDVQERHIRSLPSWKLIRQKYLQKERKVEYVFTYTIRSFTTDEELLDMYGKRPDAFNEDELLRVAALMDTPEKKKEVYKTITYYFPQSKVAANNLAVLYLREDNVKEARKVLMQMKEYSPEMLNTLAASYVYTADYEMAIELLQDMELPQARYNLGLLKARQRHLQEAYWLLAPFADLNSAICALSVNENEAAGKILRGLDDNTPLAEYVRSLFFARTKEDEAFFRHLPNACQDDDLRSRAGGEPDFRPYSSQERFLDIVNR